MAYMLLTLIVAVVTVSMTKEFPQARTRIGVVSFGAAVVAVAVAEVTGNLLLYYGGSMILTYGMFVLLARVMGIALDRGGTKLYRDK